MGRRGPAPTPTKLKVLRGNPGKRPLNQREPQPAAGVPAMPAWLSAEAKAEWELIVPELLALGLLAVIDRMTLAAYCQSVAELRWATETLEKEGRIILEPLLNREGIHVLDRMKAHPAVKLQRDAFARVKQFLSEFGLSPSSRSRLQVADANAQKEKDNPLVAIFRRREAREQARPRAV